MWRDSPSRSRLTTDDWRLTTKQRGGRRYLCRPTSGRSHPRPGHRSPSWLKREQQRTFRKARAWRAGGEARIARLKNTFGMQRSRYKGESGIGRAAHWAAIANNLMAIGAHA